MKKLIFGAAILVSAFFAASCQQEMLDPQAEGTTVTYTVEVPGALATKAADGFELIYEVYREDNTLIYESAEPIPFDQTGKVELSLEFVKDQNFTVLFWAQKTGSEVYNVANLQAVKLNTGLHANDGMAEVFAGIDTVNDCESTSGGNVELVRPIAQINIATLTSGLTLGEGTNAHNVDPGKISVAVAGLYNTYNVATSTASGTLSTVDAPVSYAEADAPKTPFNTDYTLVGSTYVGFIPSIGATVNVDFTLNAGQDGNINHKVSNVPVKPNYKTNIIGNLISATADYNVTLGAWADAEITHPMDGVSLQTALDNAVPGTTIQLEPGVNYGTLYLRPSANADVTKVVDWVGNDYRYETYSLFQDITIKGAEGATVDAIEIEGGTYYNTPHSQSSKYPIMLSLIELKNVVIDGVTFSGKGGYDPQGHGNAINLSGNNIKVDGLTIQNCTLNNPENNARLIYKTESTTTEHKYTYDDQTKALQEYTFTPSLKNIKVTGTTFNGGYIGLELRETENVTIANNTFNVADRNILLPVNSGCTYSGKVTITDNVSNNAKQRFVRMSGAGDAEVVIKNNTINNYQGADADYIKVTDGTNVIIENNVLGASTAAALQHLCDLATGTTNIMLTDDIKGDVMICQKENVHINIIGADMSYDGTIKVHNASTPNNGSLSVSDVNFSTDKVYYDSDGKPYFYFVQADDFGVIDGVTCRYSQNVTVDGCTFTTTNVDVENYAAGVFVRSSKNAKVLKCTATGVHSLIQAQSCDEKVEVNECTVNNGKNGIAFKAVKNAVVDNCTITAAEYGIRFDGDQDNYGITVKNNNVTAVQPLIVRKMTGANNTIALEGANTLTTEAEYQIVITKDSDDKPYVKPTGTYTLTGADAYSVYPAPVLVASWDEFTKALNDGETDLKLTADITYNKIYNINKKVNIDLNGNSLTMSDPALYYQVSSAVSIKNGTIAGKLYAEKGSLTLSNVKFAGTVAGNSITGSLYIKAGNVLATDCKFDSTPSGTGEIRPLTIQTGANGSFKFVNCNFKSNGTQKQVYVNSISSSSTLDFIDCSFKGAWGNKAANIDLGASFIWSNMNLTGCSGGFTFTITRASTSLSAEELEVYRAIKSNNSGSMRFIFSDGEKNNL